MKYISTRGRAPALDFSEVLLSGLAPDGGLYLPNKWPTLSSNEIGQFSSLQYAELALKIIQPFVGGGISKANLTKIINNAYNRFTATEVVPMKRIGTNEYLLELFHGPTLAFKDIALQVLGNLFDHVLVTKGRTSTIIGATSGDTGSAAIEALRDRDTIEIFMLHPFGRISDVQRRQMTTVQSSNIYNVAIKGTFDDCQDLVKAMFNDQLFCNRMQLGAVNSINWARIMSQIVYYFYAATRISSPTDPISFTVPTGNFGNVFSGYAAKCMGLNVDQFVIGSNKNDILTRFLETGSMTIKEVHSTISPSMDIQVSSNFERLLFDLLNKDGLRVKEFMDEFRNKGKFSIDGKTLDTTNSIFYGACFDDEVTKKTIREIYEETGELIDPHTAVGIAAGRAQRHDKNIPMVALATAHPAKFPNAVKDATGKLPKSPVQLEAILKKEEHFIVLENDLEMVRNYISDHSKVNK